MVNYTDHLTTLMRDIVSRVDALSYIDMDDVLVFARFGRAGTDGSFATCHCLNLPPSEPGYYFWRDRRTGEMTRRSEWFVAKSPEVRIGARRIKYLISFTLPRFCDQRLDRSRKAVHYVEAEPWLAKLDTVMHELYHIDPLEPGIRRIERADGSYSPRSHGPRFYEDVARMVSDYLATRPDASVYDFLCDDFSSLTRRFGGVLGLTFRRFPSYPQRYLETMEIQPDGPKVRVEPIRTKGPALFTEADLRTRQFLPESARVLGASRQMRPLQMAV